MALQVPSYPDPTSTAPIVNAYVEVIDFHLSGRRKTVNFTVGYYRTADDEAAEVEPAGTASYTITPNRETRADGAALPSYADVVASAKTTAADPVGTLGFSIVQRSIYEFLMTLPEFAGASIVA